MLDTKNDRLLRLPQVLERVGLSRPTLYRRIEAGEFPKQIKLGTSSAWPESEVSAYVEKAKASRA